MNIYLGVCNAAKKVAVRLPDAQGQNQHIC